MNYELYRRSAPGQALLETLDELVNNQQIAPQLAMRVLSQFDRSMSEALNNARTRCHIRGHLRDYRYLDDVWTFMVMNARVRCDDEMLASQLLKIVACNARKAELAPNAAAPPPAQTNASHANT